MLAALYTEICLAMPAIHALAEGYDVFIVTDASGGVTAEAHDMAVRRMVAAGAVPINWLAVLGEWAHCQSRQGRRCASALPRTPCGDVCPARDVHLERRFAIGMQHGTDAAASRAWESGIASTAVTGGRTSAIWRYPRPSASGRSLAVMNDRSSATQFDCQVSASTSDKATGSCRPVAVLAGSEFDARKPSLDVGTEMANAREPVAGAAVALATSGQQWA